MYHFYGKNDLLILFIGEKLELEKQAAELAQQQSKENSTTTTDNSF